MFLSVILPIYNVEKYLNQCLNSILNQDFKDYEIVLVDDGSSDSCPKLCDDFASAHNNVKVIHKRNGGSSSARNAGLAVAEGDYVYFLDSDDYLLNNDFFSKVFNCSQSNSDIILFKHIRYFENKNRFGDCNYDYKIKCTSFPKIVMELVQKDAFFGMAWIKVVKKSALITNDIIFPMNLLGEDMPWNLDLYLNAKSISLIDSVEYVYRQRDNSVTTTTGLKILTDFIGILENKYHTILNSDCNGELKTALLGALAKYYSNLLITYVRITDALKKTYLKRVKKLSVLLNYSLSERPLKIKRIYKLFGLKVTLFLLQVIDRRRK